MRHSEEVYRGNQRLRIQSCFILGRNRHDQQLTSEIKILDGALPAPIRQNRMRVVIERRSKGAILRGDEIITGTVGGLPQHVVFGPDNVIRPDPDDQSALAISVSKFCLHSPVQSPPGFFQEAFIQYGLLLFYGTRQFKHSYSSTGGVAHALCKIRSIVPSSADI